MSARRRDRDADPADLALRLRRVRVVAHLGRQVERDRQPGLALLEQVAEAPVRLRGGREAGVLAHRPEAAAVHRRLDAAGERVLARPAEVALLVEAGRVGRVVGGVDVRRSRWSRRSVANRCAPLAGRPRPLVARRVARRASARDGVGRRHRDHRPARSPELDRVGRPRPRPARRCPARGARSSFCIFIASTDEQPARRPRPRRPPTTRRRRPARDDGTDLEPARGDGSRLAAAVRAAPGGVAQVGVLDARARTASRRRRPRRGPPSRRARPTGQRTTPSRWRRPGRCRD